MDCKCENAARTAVRIEALALQGFLHGMTMAAIGVAVIPLYPFMYAAARCHNDRRCLAAKVCLVPLWFATGVVRAVTLPFSVLRGTVVGIADVVRMEWNTRWMTGVPKKPNGHPLKLPTDQEMEMRNLAYTLGVVKDYNAEARLYGQEMPIDETEL